MIKKILYVAFQYEYAKKENGTALNYKAWYENFVKLGYDVSTLFYEDYSKVELQEAIVKKANKIQPDLIFFVLQKDQVDTETLQKIKDNGFFTVNFFGDDQWRFESFSSKFASYFSACITTDKFSVIKYKEMGQNNIIRSQWASLESDVNYHNVIYKYDVSFVGGKNPYRQWFVDQLLKKGISVQCFGNGWLNQRVTYEEMENIFLTSRINLNISNSTSFDVRYLLSGFRRLLSTVKAVIQIGKNSSQTKARNFEIPVQGGFQLTDYIPTLEEYFEIGKEVICYNNVDEIEKLILYYLKNPGEREVVKLAGISRARSEHTFVHRVDEFMRELEVIKGNDFEQD